MDKQLHDTLQNLAQGYTFKNGIIRNPGKFEQEPIETLYYYDAMLNGDGDIIELSDDEKKVFRLNSKLKYVVVCETDSGFVELHYFRIESAAEKFRDNWYYEEF